jgi:molecular chaperone DnaK (HSP70)
MSSQVQRMLQEADVFSKEDHRRREAVDAKNQADSLIYRTEKLLKETVDVPTSVRYKVEEKVKVLKQKVEEGISRYIQDSIVALEKELIELEDSAGHPTRAKSDHSEGGSGSLHSAG